MKYFAILLLWFSGQCFSAAVPMTPGMVSVTSGGFTTAANFVGSFSGAAFNNTFSTNVGGTAVTMPASMRMAANAGNFAVGAVRSTPAGLIGTAVAAWLITQGIEYIDGQFKKNSTNPLEGVSVWSNGYTNRGNGGQPYNGTLYGAVQKAAQTIANDNCGGSFNNEYFCPSAGSWVCSKVSATSYNCGNRSSAYVNNTFTAVSVPTNPQIPATDTDFAPLAAAPLPDAVASELANKGVPIPLLSPDFANPYQDIPLGYPKTDPVTGQRYQDKARVTPNPDGKTADVEPFKQPLNPDGTPATDPNGNPLPPEQEADKDPCETAPDRLSCIEKGEVDEVDLQTQNAGTSVSPVSVGGGGSCPANKTIGIHGGSLTFSYQPICQFATMINPLVLAIAWLGAGFILIGAFRE